MNPRFIGILRIKPKNPQDKSMVSDSEIEKIGMDFVMDYERQSGRIPEDVSAQNLGFDIRSQDKSKSGTTRYIEVKTRANRGEVALTQNEWFKARRFGVSITSMWCIRHHPSLNSILLESSRIHSSQRKIETVRYIISLNSSWKKEGAINHEP